MDFPQVSMIRKYFKKIRNKLPYIGRLINDRDKLLTERDKLLIELGRLPIKYSKTSELFKIINKRSAFYVDKRDSLLIDTKLGKAQIKNKFRADYIKKLLKGKKNIFDVGSGSKGSYWWDWIDKDATITGIDLYFFPKNIPNNVKIYKFDAAKLGIISKHTQVSKLTFIAGKAIFRNIYKDWYKHFDMVVANHILEHVESPEKTIKGIAKLLKKGGIAYVGIPDSRNFLDIFYHILFPNGGGHISYVTNEIIYKHFSQSGFELISCNVWPNMWQWLKDSYTVKKAELPYLNQDDFNYISDVFKKEISLNKGYFYGWEMVFKKT